ncbi:hypothetical protein COV82_05490 [Candidatus Peregrinibacteria bacterium CG11_big_fil_rev_8_21_14_0_20_46_8]|nr:MAG: hypothetical protein COV82_05490 [Candidatus Peregrinibacteria bacterium CG11_big_fil_rev_8_21_14_0_20_46_8]
MKKQNIIIGLIAAVALIVLLAIFIPRNQEMTQEIFDAEETARVEALNAQTSGVGLDYNADGENENPVIEDIQIYDNF